MQNCGVLYLLDYFNHNFSLSVVFYSTLKNHIIYVLNKLCSRRRETKVVDSSQAFKKISRQKYVISGFLNPISFHLDGEHHWYILYLDML